MLRSINWNDCQSTTWAKLDLPYSGSQHLKVNTWIGWRCVAFLIGNPELGETNRTMEKHHFSWDSSLFRLVHVQVHKLSTRTEEAGKLRWLWKFKINELKVIIITIWYPILFTSPFCLVYSDWSITIFIINHHPFYQFYHHQITTIPSKHLPNMSRV